MGVTRLLIELVVCLMLSGALNADLFPIEIKYPLLGNPEPPGSPWPKPKYIGASSTKLLYLSKKNFEIRTNMNNVKCDIIDKNIQFYTNILFPPILYAEPSSVSESQLLKSLQINIEQNGNCPGYPDSNIDETYELKIQTSQATLKSKSVWGALRGLETFSQLIFVTKEHTFALNDSTEIRDEPRFKYRGMLLDTARHFIPVPILKKQIDAMSYNKLNVLHWHIVDDQSFPLESLKYPNLTKNGRYSEAHVYKQTEIKDIIDHARLRGIRVIPEFDSPGHVNAFGLSFPQFITVCWKDNKPYQAIYSVQGEAEIFNPTIEGLYPVVKDVLNEFKSVFPDEYIHLGNDEVYYECWKSNPNISEWMKKMNFTQYNQLEAYYSTRLLDIAKQLNKKVTVWQDVYDNGVKLDKSTQIQIWKDTNTDERHKKWYEYMEEMTKEGYQVILSSPWYINFVSYGYQEWYKWYEIEPLAYFNGPDEQKALVIGGEVCLWAEYVDGSNIESRLWPRASVIAERLWSPSYVNNTEDSKFRLDEHRCRLLRRGVPATPVLNGYCGDYEYGMAKSVIFEQEFNYNWPKLRSGNGATNLIGGLDRFLYFLFSSLVIVYFLN